MNKFVSSECTCYQFIITISEELAMAKEIPTNGTWEQDFEKFIPQLIIEDQPCYILYRYFVDFSVIMSHRLYA